MLLIGCTAALLACGALLAACGDKETPPPAPGDEAVSVAGQIVFDADSERTDHNFNEDITLRFTPVNGSVDGAAATLLYSDGEGKSAAKDGFTLAASGSGFTLRDGDGNAYDTELTWSPDGTESSVTIHGAFIADSEIEDYEGADNAVYHGHFGLAGVAVSHDMWWIRLGEVPRTQTKCLNVYNATILDVSYYVDPLYGENFSMYNFIPGDGGYIVDLFLTEKDGSRRVLVKSVRYIPEQLTWTTDPIPVNDGYEREHWEDFAITKATLLYSAELFGYEEGTEFYIPYDYNEPTHTVARQELYATWKGENGEHYRMFFRDQEVGLVFYVDLDEDGEIAKIYEAYAGFVFDFTPDSMAEFPYAFGAFLLSNEVDVYTPHTIYEFGYMKDGAIYYPSEVEIVRQDDNTFSVKELGGGGEVLHEWTVWFTDLEALVPVPHAEEVSSAPVDKDAAA